MSSPSVSIDFTRAVFDYLAELGFDEAAVAKEAGFPLGLLDHRQRIPYKLYASLFEAGESLTGDNCFGLHMGLAPWPRSWGLVSHLAVAAPNAMAAVGALMNYSELQLDFLRFELQQSEQGESSLVWLHPEVPELAPHVAEHLLANITALASTQIGYQISLQHIELMHPGRGQQEELESCLNARVSFDCPGYRVRASADFLNQPAVYGEDSLFKITEDLAQQRLMELRDEDPFLNAVRETVLRQLPNGLPKIDRVAAELEMSARSLQRRLLERNLRYQVVLDEVRRELCRQLIADRSLSLNDVADYLGFNDQSAFQHAFRRWEGTTPGRYRRDIAVGLTSSPG